MAPSSFTPDNPLTGVGYSSLSAADYNGDGHLDLVLIGQNTTGQPIAKLYQNTSEGLTEDPTLPLPGLSNSAVNWGDYTGDRKPDLIISGLDATRTRVTKLYRNTENGLVEDTSITLPGVSNGSLAWADYDGDGKADLMLTGLNAAGTRITKLYRNTDSGLLEDTTVVLPGVSNSSIARSDYDGDGRLDLLLTGMATTPIAKLYRNTGTGFQEDTSIALPGVQFGSVAWADYSGDGKPDFLLTGRTANQQPIAKLYRNTGTGFQEDTSVTLPGVYFSAVAWADYNGDRKPDLFLSGLSATGTAIARLYQNTGNGFQEDFSSNLTGVSLGSVAWADYSRDGRPDLLLAGFTMTGEAIAQLYKNTYTPPVQITLTTDAPAFVNQPFTATAHFSDPVTDLTEQDIQVTNGTISDLQSSDGQTFTFTVTPTDQDEVTVTIPVNTVGTVNSGKISRIYDSLAPSMPTFDATVELTKNNRLPLTGMAEAGSTVTVTLSDGSVVGTVISDRAGRWELVPTVALTDSFHSLTATATDAAGNTSQSSGDYNLSVDTLAPDAPLLSSDRAFNIAKPTLAGTAEANSTIQIQLNDRTIASVKATASGEWSFTPAVALPDGRYALRAIATDAAGNDSLPTTEMLVIDTLTPAAPGLTGNVPNNGRMNGSRFTLSGTTDPASTVKIFHTGELLGETTSDAVTGAWRYSFQQNPLLDGDYRLTATVTDIAGNTSPLSSEFAVTIDNDPPVIALSSDTSEVIIGAFPVAVSIEPDATPLTQDKVTIANGSIRNFRAIDRLNYEFEVIPDQEETVIVIVSENAIQDIATNSSETIQLTRIYDKTPPAIPVITNAKTLTNDARPILTGTAEANTRVQLFQDQQPISMAVTDEKGEWLYPITTALSDGTYAFTASTIDDAGNVSGEAIAFTLTIDTRIPEAPTFTSPVLTHSKQPTFAGNAPSGTTVQVKLGDQSVGNTAADNNGQWALTAPATLPDGSYTVTATTTNPAGTTSALSVPLNLTIDSTAPTVQVTNAPETPRTTAIADLILTFSEAISGFEINDLRLTRDNTPVSLNTATLESADHQRFTLSGLTDLTTAPGDYQLVLAARTSGIIDRASNSVSNDAVVTWSIPKPLPPKPPAPTPEQTIAAALSGNFSSLPALLTLNDNLPGLNPSTFRTRNGNGTANTLTGTPTSDLLRGFGGSDRLSGAAGNDTLSGGDGNDTLIGGVGNDLLLGGAGNDQLVGDQGNDILIGGTGRNVYTGGQGSDRFILRSRGEHATITDFSGGDRLVIVANQLGGLPAGQLSTRQFRLGATAQTASNRLIYQRETGKLFFDIDGRGGRAAVELAQFQAGTALSAQSIWIV